MAHFDDVI